MTKLLDDNDFAEIRSTVNDVMETFTQKEIIYKLSEKHTPSRFGRDNHITSNKTDKLLLALVVWEVNQSELEAREFGRYDFSIGYALFGWDYLVTEGLITGTPLKPIFIPEKDKIVIDGDELEIIGVWHGGQLKDTDAVVKVYFKNVLKNG